jgi:hypothetical protein
VLILDLEPVFQAELQFEQAVNRYDASVRRGVQTATEEGAKLAAQTHRYEDQTGLLTSRIKGFIEISVPGSAVGILGAFTDYASFVEGGTRPHEIHGNPYLTFKAKDGTWVTTTMVHHPGTRAYGFMGDAFLKAERILLREVEVAGADLQAFLDS